MSKVQRLMEDFGEFEVNETEFWYWFHVLNDEIFGDTVPLPNVIETVGPEEKDWGYVTYADYDDIRLVAVYVRQFYPNKAIFVEVLAHEMIHVWQRVVLRDNGYHNDNFWSWKPKFDSYGIPLREDIDYL